MGPWPNLASLSTIKKREVTQITTIRTCRNSPPSPPFIASNRVDCLDCLTRMSKFQTEKKPWNGGMDWIWAQFFYRVGNFRVGFPIERWLSHAKVSFLMLNSPNFRGLRKLSHTKKKTTSTFCCRIFCSRNRRCTWVKISPAKFQVPGLC